MTTSPTRVAVACQGGGSHTAFTAGVLAELLETLDEGDRLHLTDASGGPKEVELAALTGTSGGAVCALAAWYGLQTGDGTAAARLLERVWEDISARQFDDWMTNEAALSITRSQEAGLPVPQVSPYDTPFAAAARNRLRSVLLDVIDERQLETLVRSPTTGPRVLVSAVNVQDGCFETFTDRYYATTSTRVGDGRAERFAERISRAPRPLSIDAVLASAAVPTLFRAMPIDHDGTTHRYWDGLFSQNPPIRDLFTVDQPGGAGRRPRSAADQQAAKPDEIWLVRINPEERASEPTRLPDIVDRRNELSGNLSLQQELHLLSLVNRWIEDGRFAGASGRDSNAEPESESDAGSASVTSAYKPITVRELALDRELLASSKLNRRPSFVDGLREDGRAAAASFLADPAARTPIVGPENGSAAVDRSRAARLR